MALMEIWGINEKTCPCPPLQSNISTDLRHPVIAIQKVDISLHGVAAILYEILQGDSGSAKEPLKETPGTMNNTPMHK